MRRDRARPQGLSMTTTGSPASTVPGVLPSPPPPLSTAARLATGVCLVLAGLLNGGSQYASALLGGDHDTFSEQIRQGFDQPLHQVEQAALVVSMLVLPLGLLGLAQVTRWDARRLTAVAVVLVVWGMWGFTNVVALGYAAGTVAPGAIGVDAAVRLNEAYLEHPVTLVTALYPHLLGSFLGLVLLCVAGWRTRVLPRVPLGLLLAFLVWDFTLPSAGPVEPHLLLLVALVWLGVRILGMPQATWLGGRPDGRPQPSPY